MSGRARIRLLSKTGSEFRANHASDARGSADTAGRFTEVDSIRARTCTETSVASCRLALRARCGDQLSSLRRLFEVLAFCSHPLVSRHRQYDQKYMVANTMFPHNKYVVLMGNSMINKGVYPELLTELLKKGGIKDVRVVNLALDGGAQSDALKYLGFLAQRGVQPALVIYNFDVQSTQHQSNMFASNQDKTFLYNSLLDRPKDLRRSLLSNIDRTITLIRYREQYKTYIDDFFATCANDMAFSRSLFHHLDADPS